LEVAPAEAAQHILFRNALTLCLNGMNGRKDIPTNSFR
jgi:hypothetical protein